MIVKYHGESSPLSLIDEKHYEVIAIECGMYRIIDEECIVSNDKDGYLYPSESFEIISGSEDEYIDEFNEE